MANGEGPQPLKTPDVTMAQGGSVALLAGSIAAVASGSIDSATVEGLVAGFGALVSAVWMIVDQRIRAERARNLGASVVDLAAAREGPQFYPVEPVRQMVEGEPDLAYAGVLEDGAPVEDVDEPDDDPYTLTPQQEGGPS